MPRKTKKDYHYPKVRVADAAALQQRIADGQATPDEAQRYKRIINELTARYLKGELSPASARRFGIE
jgi:hypothetical protein